MLICEDKNRIPEINLSKCNDHSKKPKHAEGDLTKQKKPFWCEYSLKRGLKSTTTHWLKCCDWTRTNGNGNVLKALRGKTRNGWRLWPEQNRSKHRWWTGPAAPWSQSAHWTGSTARWTCWGWLRRALLPHWRKKKEKKKAENTPFNLLNLHAVKRHYHLMGTNCSFLKNKLQNRKCNIWINKPFLLRMNKCF